MCALGTVQLTVSAHSLAVWSFLLHMHYGRVLLRLKFTPIQISGFLFFIASSSSELCPSAYSCLSLRELQSVFSTQLEDCALLWTLLLLLRLGCTSRQNVRLILVSPHMFPFFRCLGLTMFVSIVWKLVLYILCSFFVVYSGIANLTTPCGQN